MSAIIKEAERTTMYDIFDGGASSLLWNGSVDRQLVSHRINGSNYLMQSSFRVEQSVSDQDDVQIVGHDASRYNATIQDHAFYFSFNFFLLFPRNLTHNFPSPLLKNLMSVGFGNKQPVVGKKWKIGGKIIINRYKAIQCPDTRRWPRCNATIQGYTMQQHKVILGLNTRQLMDRPIKTCRILL